MEPDAPIEEEDIDFDYAQTIIRETWKNIAQGRDLGRAEAAREVMMESQYVKGDREKDAAVRMWCETLRLRG